MSGPPFLELTLRTKTVLTCYQGQTGPQTVIHGPWTASSDRFVPESPWQASLPPPKRPAQIISFAECACISSHLLSSKISTSTLYKNKLSQITQKTYDFSTGESDAVS